ncbi:PREDICTED: endogenous retrovirus group K member 18 Pol protein-like [Pseudopodoces humilis]|uniref:endogenous retrovirus group K member 18 Pol protein-like n=1 Tax=Pseudopodoces humilis TaxID=181119 RepID=UPI0006B6C6D1|nr:PREDICTED: endogenous retrovirus group K member 18 Pol protein-like [Pseudopodoces humilis]
MNHLCGEGDWSEPIDQAQNLPKGVREKIKKAAEKAFFNIPLSESVVPYAQVKQCSDERFVDFVNRLKVQIERQVQNTTLHSDLLLEMARVNANEACKALIRVLPKDPPPTLTTLIEMCTDVISTSMPRTEDSQRTPGRIAATTVPTLPSPAKPKGAFTCHRCGQPGHFAKFCQVPYPNKQGSDFCHRNNTNGCEVWKPKLPLKLFTVKDQFFRSRHWTVVSVDPLREKLTPDLNCKFLVIGDTKNTPPEIEISPVTLSADLDALILLARCINPPFYLAQGQVIAQAIPIPSGIPVDDVAPQIYWAQAVGENKPIISCHLKKGSEGMGMTGMIDTGADVTVIPERRWPPQWELQPMVSHIQDSENTSGFLIAATEKRQTQKLEWTTDSPIWIPQWPLSKEKLKALNELVDEQLAQGNIEPTFSPWNSPVFVIKKPGKDKWRLVHDLREINKVIVDMGPLQPGMPSPAMLPQNWELAVIDIKDCFFKIPLDPIDAPRFAFSVPSLNREAPMRRFHWKSLPQGMKNSPVICQWYVAALLSPVRAEVGEAIILHYMDDVLVCAPQEKLLQSTLDRVTEVLTTAGLTLQEEKVQKMPPWKYLGLEITAKTIVPQKLAFNSNPKTLADLHSLCGTLNWVRPWLGIATDDLAPLFNLLKGGDELSAPRTLTPEARDALEKVSSMMEKRQAHRCHPELPFKFIVMGKLPHLQGLIFQWDKDQKDHLIIIEWVFLSHHRSKNITRPQELMAQLVGKARLRMRELAGCDFSCIHLPLSLSEEETSSVKMTREMFEHLLRNQETLQIALENFTGQISVHAPAHKLFNSKFNLVPKDKRSQKPLEALTVFTDASGASRRSVMTWKDPQTQQWETDVDYVEGSPQIAELAAVVRAFERFSEPFNLVTDSAYVAGVVSRAENAVLKEISNRTLFELLSKLIYAVSHREHPYFVMHTRSHMELPGFIAEGNDRADSLAAAPVGLARLPDLFQQAKLSHEMFHQNVPGLIRQFNLKRDQAKAIVATCPHCQRTALPSLGAGVNPRGLKSCEVWQTDVTHIPEFGQVKYVHVSIDTFSGAIFASAHAGEKGVHATKHLLQAFSVLGIPKEIKTDNGPAYISKVFKEFLQEWGVRHKTGIPHSPTGQAIVERAHQSLKRVLKNQWKNKVKLTPQERLCKALFTLNFLNCSMEDQNPPVVKHFSPHGKHKLKEHPPVLMRDPESGKIEGPYKLVTWGRGYACVSTPLGLRWVPQRWVKPYIEKHPTRPPDISVAEVQRTNRYLGGEGNPDSPFYPDFPLLNLFIDEFS